MKIKLFIYLILIILGALVAIGGIWASAYAMYVLEGWGTVPSIVTGIITLVGGLAVVCYAALTVCNIAKDIKCHE